jgi:hypothetical protein
VPRIDGTQFLSRAAALPGPQRVARIILYTGSLIVEFRVPFGVQLGHEGDHPGHELIAFSNSVHERRHVF